MQEWTTTACPKSVSHLRRAVGEYATRHGLLPRRVEDVVIAVSELVTNAVMHAYRDREDAGSVTVVARSDGGELTIRVADEGLGPLPRTDSPGAGLGLRIAGQMADRLEIEHLHPSGTAVCLTFAAAA